MCHPPKKERDPRSSLTASLRGKDEHQLDVFGYIRPEQRVPQDWKPAFADQP
jgi:hypothetical protein